MLDGRLITAKVPTNTVEPYLAVLEGAQRVGVEQAEIFNHASTHGLNSVITRRLPKIGFLTTAGHRDMLDHGRLIRPREAITDPRWRREFSDTRRPLVPRYLRRGIEERSDHRGQTVIPLNVDQAAAEIEVLERCDVAGVAICLLNAYANGQHERALRELVRDRLGDVPCSISSEVSPLAKEYARASTTVIDVMMKLIYGEYTDRLRSGLVDLGFRGQLNYADSAATLISSEFAMQQPFRIVFAGPAAGTAASVRLGEVIGEPNLLCADVGGTSCDISVVTDGRAYRDITFELEHDLVVNSLTTDIATLGAGGGSIVSINDLGEVCVGPESAGANPGPACYGLGGMRPTMTDACLLIGILDGDGFAGGELRLDATLSQRAFDDLQTSLDAPDRIRAAWEIGLNNVVEGLYNIALKHGVDPRDYALCAYGAAGPMILPPLLGRVGLSKVVVPPTPGLFSALGLLSTDLVYSDSRSSYTVLTPDAAEEIEATYAAMESDLLARIGVQSESAAIIRTFDARLYGQSWETPFIEVAGDVGQGQIEKMIEAFHGEYERRNGSSFPFIPVEIVTLRVQVIVGSDKLAFAAALDRDGGELTPTGTTTIRYIYGDDVNANLYDRTDMRAGDVVSGPAVIREAMSTTFVPAGHTCTVGRVGELSLR